VKRGREEEEGRRGGGGGGGGGGVGGDPKILRSDQKKGGRETKPNQGGGRDLHPEKDVQTPSATYQKLLEQSDETQRWGKER